MRAFVFRHARSVGNENALLQAESSPLSARGVKQAELMAERCARLPIRRILCGEATRARQNAEIVGGRLGIVVEPIALFNERKRASDEIGRTKGDPNALVIRKEIERNYHDPSYRHSDEETHAELALRAKAALDLLLRVGEGSCVITHSGFLKYLFGTALSDGEMSSHVGLNCRRNLKIDSAALCVFIHEARSIVGTPAWKVERWNDTSHLDAA